MHITAAISLPTKAATPNLYTPPPSHRGTLPRPFTFVGSSVNSVSTLTDVSGASQSLISSISGKSIDHIVSVTSRHAQSPSAPLDGHPRTVKQLFVSVLPDELLLPSLGEKLTVVQTLDDGWCLVARRAPRRRSVFGSTGDAVELGIVPGWCFLSSEGRVERPSRSASLSVLVQITSDARSDDTASWSNFG